MNAIHGAGMWLQVQDPGSLSSGNSKLLMLFVAMVAVAMMAQAVALIVMAIGAAKARKRGLEIAEEIRSKIMPVIDGAHELIRDTAPKVKVITENLVETSYVVRAKAEEFDVTLSDANKRTRKQVERVDDMVSSALTAVGEIAGSLQHSIRVPMREVAGVVAGFKAGVDVLVGRVKSFGVGGGFGRPRRPNNDSDLIL
ncbi:MAG: hypothetical protein JWM43_2076 [Acidobacteriaceae bacterium]|nr:hypothetical protein [Acidobacteriaceae bacterium]